MSAPQERIPVAEARRQVHLALRRAALIYHFFAQTLIDELGEEKGRRLVVKAVEAYGRHIGREARRRARERGLGGGPGNYQDDLPPLGWEAEVVIVDGERRTRIRRCPLADTWRELGSPAHARLYCFVDQAKMRAFNPDYTYVHLQNVLDGDPLCELAVRKAAEGDAPGR